MKEVVLSVHAREQLVLRGATNDEVRAAIEEGERLSAKADRVAYRKNFPFRSHWKGRYYETKQVMPIVVEEADRLVVVTVFAFYFGATE